MGIRWEDGNAQLSFSARDLVNEEVRDKLESGLPQNIVLRIYAYQTGNADPIGATVRSCRVVYDPWEEVYRVDLETETSDGTRATGTLEEVVERCLVVRRAQLTARYRRGRDVYFAALIEFNPLSPETVQRIRRWLARPGGGRSGEDAFFGSFVSLFVNRRIGAAERTLRFRSQSVEVP